MKIAHLAIWTTDIEKMREFYLKYFNGTSNEKYINEKKGFQSYFISFDEGASLEIMEKIGITENKNQVEKEFVGIAHFAFNVGSKEKVNSLTEELRKDGYHILGEPRTTGDGYYESVILDPDKNRVEIVG